MATNVMGSLARSYNPIRGVPSRLEAKGNRVPSCVDSALFSEEISKTVPSRRDAALAASTRMQGM